MFCSESDLKDYSTMDSIEDEDIDTTVFEDVETVSFDDWRREHYDGSQSKQAISEEYTGEVETTDFHMTASTEPATSIQVGSKKKLKKTSDSKVIKRPKMSDDDDEETTKSKLIILGLNCPQSGCDLMFESVKQLHQHQKSVHGVLPYPCLIDGCSQQFSSNQIGLHYSKVHPHHTNWTCAQCYVKKTNSVQLRDHIRDFHQFGRFHCARSVCTFEADLRVKVQNHQNNAHPNYICPIDGCAKAFGKKTSLQRHLKTLHNQTNTKSTNSNVARFQLLELKCDRGDCGGMFDTLNGLQQHQKTVHNLLPFACLVNGCSERFDSSRTMARHYSTVHPDHTNWNCPKCEAKLVDLRHLRQHIRNFHQFGRFRCTHVGCTFEADVRLKVLNHSVNVHGSKVVDLTEESSTSTQAGPENQSEMAIQNLTISNKSTNFKIIILELKCTQSECDMKFSTWDQLYQHLESVHGVLRFPCLVSGCSEQFNSCSQVALHNRNFHPNHTNWACSHCNVVCVSPTRLRNHVKIHDNFCRFGCFQVGCDFEENNRDRMFNHFKTHVRHICSIDECNRVFNSKISLEKHQQSVHFA